MKRSWKWLVPVKQRQTRRVAQTPGGFFYRDEQGVDRIVLWADIQSVSWYEPPYGPMGSVPSWSIHTSGGTLEVEDWWEGADELLKLFVENLSGFTLPPRAHEYDNQPPEGHPCWPIGWK